MNQQVSPCYHSFMTISQSCHSKVTLINALQVEKIAEAVLLYVFRMTFSASLLRMDCRGFSGVHKIWWRWEKNLVKASKQILLTGERFSLNLRFRKFLCSQTIDSVLFQVSRKFVLTRKSSTTPPPPQVFFTLAPAICSICFHLYNNCVKVGEETGLSQGILLKNSVLNVLIAHG